ncbi:MAG: hypothetical protein ACFB9M_19635 [Myxococcota bacterium]
MSRLEHAGDALWSRVKDAATDAKDAYENADRFARQRLYIAAALGVDVVLTFLLVWFLSASPSTEVWFEEGFPSNLLLIRNLSNSTIEEVRVILDDRYEFEGGELLPNQIKGLEVEREFRDALGRRPDDRYRPRTVILYLEGKKTVVKLQ